jgi:two-component sensor histidine kinase
MPADFWPIPRFVGAVAKSRRRWAGSSAGDGHLHPPVAQSPIRRSRAMNAFLIRRRLSAFETGVRWLALAVGLSALTTLINVQLSDLFALPFNRADWHDASTIWLRAFAGTAPIIGVLAVVPPLLPERSARRWPLLAIAIVGAVALGWLAQAGLDDVCGCDAPTPGEARAALHWLVVVAISIAALAEYRHGFVRAAESLHRAEVERLKLQSEIAQGRLQLLQAQIEPHFLFNSLANVRRLLRIDGAAGRAMLTDLLRYLESALPHLREDAPTLEREMEVVRAFLGVHQIRMGRRLKVDIDMPAELGDRVVPPMMLLTLVENALKHGLQPLLEGGSIRIGASRGPNSLRVHVADTGRGLGTSLGSGTGLANIRARLRSMYGSAAQLSLQVNEPRGVVATIELPVAAS